jgi:beta-N-acetylhexosaminidase
VWVDRQCSGEIREISGISKVMRAGSLAVSDAAFRDAGQVLIAGFLGTDAPAQLLDALRDEALGGVILFKRNLGSMPAVAALSRTIADAAGELVPFIAIDQEGGRVARLGPPILSLPPMRRLGELDDVELTRKAARALGRQLAALGINVDFAPVLDVHTNPENDVIGDRAFGDDPQIVARHGCAFAQGLNDAGVLACGKHFPGHGDTVEDSHFALPALPHDLHRLEKVELVPFRAALDVLGSIMTAHIVFRALDPERPATLSAKVVRGLLRAELGYRGLVVSDDLEMAAIADRWPIEESAAFAIEAGCDLLLICKSVALTLRARDALAERARRDEQFAERLREAAERTRAARSRLRCQPIVDPDRLAEALGSDPEAHAVSQALA